MTVRRALALLAPSLFLFLLLPQVPIAQSGGTYYETKASSERFIDCDIGDTTLCGELCAQGDSFAETYNPNDGQEECVRQTTVNDPFQCSPPPPTWIPGDYRLEPEWIFENVPAGCQYLVVRGRLVQGVEVALEPVDFWFNNDRPPEYDLVSPIQNATLNQEEPQEFKAFIHYNPNVGNPYRIRLRDHFFGSDDCTDKHASRAYVDLIEIVTETYNCDGDQSLDCVDTDDDNDGVFDNSDCAPCNAAIHPGASEVCNGVDDNCVGGVDEGFADTDIDGLVDCLDNCPTVYNPLQQDTDHDGIGDACDSCTDSDGDGYGDPGFDNVCDDDCEPMNAEIYPGAPEGPADPETCYDGVDNDCDGGADVDCGIPPTSHLPSSPPEGMDPGGSLTNLGGNPDSNAYFSLNESGTSGAKRLTRIFQFNNMPTDVPMKLYVEGYRNSTSADNFNIRYRTVSGGTCPVDTGTAGWTSAAVTITGAMPDTGTLQSVVLPASSNSIWCVRVQDSIRSSDSVANWVNLDRFVLKPHGMAP